MEKTIFDRIISGEIPSYKIFEDDKFYAFLDINPVQAGHTLVVPKKTVDFIFDMEDDDCGEMMIFAKKIAKAIKGAIECRKIGVAVIGLEVNHAHIHLIPISKEGDMDFKNKKTLSPQEMKDIQDRIIKNL